MRSGSFNLSARRRPSATTRALTLILADVTALSGCLASALPASAIGARHDPDTIALDPFLRGLATEGMEVRRRDLDLAVDVSLVVRCAFTALPVERLAGLAMQPNADRVVRQRAAWCRFLVDRGKRLLGE